MPDREPKHVGRPLTWVEWAQLQGIYLQLRQACDQQKILEKLGGEMLARGLTSPNYDGDDLVDFAGELLNSGAWTNDTLEQALAGQEITVEPMPQPAVEIPPAPPTSADPWEVLREVLEQARAPLGDTPPNNRLAGIAETARLALGEPDADA